MRSRSVLAPMCAVLFCVPAVQAKFGISKTRLQLPRPVPAAQPVLAENVFVEVRTDGRDLSQSHADLVQERLAEAFRAAGLYALTDSESAASARVSVRLRDLDAEVRDEIRMEEKYVKTGERQEWDDKKKQYVKKDVYGYRNEPVTWVRADGSLEAEVEVDPGDGKPRTRSVSADYRNEEKRDGSLPDPMRSERALRDWLVDEASARAVAEVVLHPEPVEALLAVNGELKEGNQLAQQGRFKEALEAWNRRSFKGDTEAARLHNVGVAYEALAYGIPAWDPEHAQLLQSARDHYERARRLDPDEKYFAPPLERVAASVTNATDIAAQKAEIDRFRSGGGEGRRAVASGPTRVSRPSETAPGAATAPTSGAGAPLTNGSFESGLDPWALTGKASVVGEAGRSKVAQLAAGAGSTGLAQTLALDVGEGERVPLRLDYRVISGEVRLAVRVTYADAQAKERTATLEVTNGEGPGEWSSWGTDLGALRPRPARVRELVVEARGGTVRLDAVGLGSR
jgi:tetratricopeptide (TPR) repeat protein